MPEWTNFSFSAATEPLNYSRAESYVTLGQEKK